MGSSPEPATSHLSPQRNPLSKLAILLGSVFGLICFACCGGTLLVEQNSKSEVFTDNDGVAAVGSEIAHLELPPGFKAKRAQVIKTMFEDVSAAVWETDKGSTILLGRVSEKFDLVGSNFEQALARVPLGASINRPPNYGSSGTTIDVEINGEKITFDIQELTMFGMPGMRQTSGVFPTTDGRTGIIYILSEQKAGTTSDEIENILHSIR